MRPTCPRVGPELARRETNSPGGGSPAGGRSGGAARADRGGRRRAAAPRLSRPAPRDLARLLGLQTSPRLAEYDTVIIGGGPAGPRAGGGRGRGGGGAGGGG